MAIVTDKKNFLPEQYKVTNSLPINHNYLSEQFADYEVIFDKIKSVIIKGDYTLGETVDHFESEFAKVVQTKHAIGVGSGTDALFLSLKALNIGPGDEVITTPFTFYATIGAIVTAGARPVFVDVLDDYNINPDLLEAKITKKTKAILPVHWAGKPCEMEPINSIAQKFGVAVVEDACHAVKATYKAKTAGSLGTLGCFSFHPLKNLNVWGDGGIITTNSDELADRLRLIRNHGLSSRDQCLEFSYNSRLDTLQAIVAQHMLDRLDHITDSRIKNANYYDAGLKNIAQIYVPHRTEYIKQVYHLYCIRCQDRDALQKYLVARGIDAKIHYPIPMHLQPAAKYLGYKAGDFPSCEKIAHEILSLPVHEFLQQEMLDQVISAIKEFYNGN